MKKMIFFSLLCIGFLSIAQGQDELYNDLMEAAMHGAIEFLHLYINHGADINLQDKNGQTTLIFASLNNELDTVQLLLDNGADKNISDSSGNTALTHAQLEKYAKIVELLQDAEPT